MSKGNFKVIGFTGKMGVGKSEAIKALMKFAYPAQKTVNVKFAQPLYDIQSYVYERVRREVPVSASGERKDRKLLQLLGTEWGRNTVSESIWIDLWKNQVNFTKNNGVFNIAVCDDVRFDNEAFAIKEMRGVIVKISSHQADMRIAVSGVSHASEAGVSDNLIDYIVENNGTLTDYQDSLVRLFKKIGVGEGSNND